VKQTGASPPIVRRKLPIHENPFMQGASDEDKKKVRE
jgi:hypothetical protein